MTSLVLILSILLAVGCFVWKPQQNGSHQTLRCALRRGALHVLIPCALVATAYLVGIASLGFISNSPATIQSLEVVEQNVERTQEVAMSLRPGATLILVAFSIWFAVAIYNATSSRPLFPRSSLLERFSSVGLKWTIRYNTFTTCLVVVLSFATSFTFFSGALGNSLGDIRSEIAARGEFARKLRFAIAIAVEQEVLERLFETEPREVSNLVATREQVNKYIAQIEADKERAEQIGLTVGIPPVSKRFTVPHVATEPASRISIPSEVYSEPRVPLSSRDVRENISTLDAYISRAQSRVLQHPSRQQLSNAMFEIALDGAVERLLPYSEYPELRVIFDATLVALEEARELVVEQRVVQPMFRRIESGFNLVRSIEAEAKDLVQQSVDIERSWQVALNPRREDLRAHIERVYGMEVEASRFANTTSRRTDERLTELEQRRSNALSEAERLFDTLKEGFPRESSIVKDLNARSRLNSALRWSSSSPHSRVLLGGEWVPAKLVKATVRALDRVIPTGDFYVREDVSNVLRRGERTLQRAAKDSKGLPNPKGILDVEQHVAALARIAESERNPNRSFERIQDYLASRFSLEKAERVDISILWNKEIKRQEDEKRAKLRRARVQAAKVRQIRIRSGRPRR